MKIGEVEIGKEYGASDEPSRRYGADPRQVRVLEVVVEEERVYSGFTSGIHTKNVRRLKVEVLDAGPTSKRSHVFAREKIKSADKGSTLIIEARHLVGLWKDINPGIVKRRNEEQARLEAEHALIERIISIVGGKSEYDRFHTDVRGPHPSTFAVTFKGAALTKILTLAEKGKGAV